MDDEEVIGAGDDTQGDPFDDLDNLDTVETDDSNHDDIAAAAADLEAFFGPLDDEDEGDDTEVEGEGDNDGAATGGAEDNGDTAVSTPPAAAAAAQAAASEQQADEPDSEGEGENDGEDAVPLNHLGMPDISDEEWAEFLADPSLPAGEAQREYVKYLNEYARRDALFQVQVQETRRVEIEESHTRVKGMFGAGDKAEAHVKAEVEKIMAHVEPAQRNNAGYYEWATNLVLARDMALLFSEHGVNPAFLKEIAQAQQPADAEAERTPTPAARRLARGSGGSTPPPAARATGSAAAGSTLTPQEKAIAKELGMTLAEYEQNKQ